MLVASLLDHILNIERASFACIKLANANFDFCTQAREGFHAIEQLPPDLFLRSIR